MKFLSLFKSYFTYILYAVIIVMAVSIGYLKYSNSSKDEEIAVLELQAAQLELDIQAEKRNTLIKAVEATTVIRKETANEKIQTIINNGNIVRGTKWL